MRIFYLKLTVEVWILTNVSLIIFIGKSLTVTLEDDQQSWAQAQLGVSSIQIQLTPRVNEETKGKP